MRRLHDLTAGVRRYRGRGWQVQVSAPVTWPVICQSEAGPHNAVYRGGQPVAFIDWDLAAPDPREWAIAYALWRFVPLYDDDQSAALGWPVRPRGSPCS